MSDEPRRIHVVVDLAAGGDIAILNTLNDVLRARGVGWDVSITRGIRHRCHEKRSTGTGSSSDSSA